MPKSAGRSFTAVIFVRFEAKPCTKLLKISRVPMASPRHPYGTPQHAPASGLPVPEPHEPKKPKIKM